MAYAAPSGRLRSSAICGASSSRLPVTKLLGPSPKLKWVLPPVPITGPLSCGAWSGVVHAISSGAQRSP